MQNMNLFNGSRFFVQSLVVSGLWLSGMSASFAEKKLYSVPENDAGTHYMLGIIGYNYTDNLISGFSVNGQSGGDIGLSSPTAGGGSTACCVLLSKKSKWPMHVLVRWQEGGCRMYDKNRRYGHNQYYYRETEVSVERGSKENPSDMAVHFFTDGSVRVILSDGWDLPLIKLNENRAIEKKLPECKIGETMQFL